MKKILFIFSFFLSLGVFGQVPPAFNYQCLIRGADGKLLPSQQVGTRFSILQGNPDGESVYTETQTGQTNENGLLTLIIGFGDSQDDFTEIDWTNVPYYVKVETDTEGGSNYTLESTTLLTSVPYALQTYEADYSNAVFTENETGKFIAYLGEGSNSGGYLTICNQNAESVVTSYCAEDSLGLLYTQSESGRLLNEISFTANGGQSGFIGVYGKNNGLNVAMSCLEGYPENGYIAVKDANEASQAGMYVDQNGKGVLFADIKNFSVPYPGDSTKTINYASLEGPEAAVYIRGTAELLNGDCKIELPEHFKLVGSEQNLTVLVTPLSAESKGLAVIEKSTSVIIVRELFNGKGNYMFDYEIKTVRKGYENYEVVRKPVVISGTESPLNKSLKSAPILKRKKSINF